MRISREAVLWSVLALATPALADDAAKAKPKVSRSQTKTLTATVTAVDQENRTVTLTGADGEARTFVVGKDVRNLPQVKVGDEVTAQYKESLAVYVKKTEPGTVLADPAMAEAANRAKLGDKPAGAVAKTSTISATVTAVDTVANTVTLKGPKGNSQTIKVKDPKSLEGVNIGDTVTAEYTEALAVAVSPAAPKKPPAKKTKTAPKK
jgi:hypothetical protein